MKTLASIWSRTKIVTLSRIVVTMMALSGIFFTTAFLSVKDNTEQLLQDWKTISANHANFDNNPEFTQQSQALEELIIATSSLIDLYIIAVLVAVAFFTLLMYFTLIGKIARPLANMKDGIENITQSNDFSVKLSTKHQDEVSQVLKSFNLLTKNLQQTFDNTNQTLEKVANGQFDQQVEIQVQGDLEVFKNNVNASIRSVAVTMNSLEEVINAISHGDFSVRMDERVQGSLKTKVDHAMATMDQIIDDINRVMEQVTNCKFNERVNVEAEGRLNELKHYINQAMDGLESGLSAINLSIQDLSNKDLTHHIQGTFSGEIEVLKQRINHTSTQLNDTVSLVSASAHALDSEIANIAQGNQQLSQRTNTQAASIDQTATAMQQITATIHETAQNAADANNKTVSTQKLAQQGSKFMQQTVQSMQAIQTESMKIRDIIDLIDSIAFQTNLLALNAAVEAARAGEQGKGFAVVAGEVRNLAQQSANAAKQISDLINEVVGKVDIGANQINQTNEMFNEIHQGIRNVDELVTNIAKSAKEQSAGMQQINGAISELDQGIRDNSQLVKQTKTKSDNLVALSQDLQSEVDTFKLKNRLQPAKS